MLLCVVAFIFLASASAIETTPAAVELLEQANQSYREMRSGDAVRLYRKYLKEDPANASARTFLAAALFNLNETEEARREVLQALADDSRLPKAYVLLGRIYASQASWDAAEDSFARALRLDSKDRDALYFSGRAFYDANRFELAIERFRKALDLGTPQSRMYENLALCYEALNLPAKAEEAYLSAVQLAGDQYRPYLAYGRFLFKQARADESVKPLRKAFEIQPGVTDVRFEFARALYHRNDFSNAAQVLSGALASNECRIHSLMTKILASEGKKEAADQEIRSLQSCLSDEAAKVSSSAAQ